MMLVKTFVRFPSDSGEEFLIDPASVVAIVPMKKGHTSIHLIGDVIFDTTLDADVAARRVIKGVDYMKLRSDAQAARDALVPESGEEK